MEGRTIEHFPGWTFKARAGSRIGLSDSQPGMPMLVPVFQIRAQRDDTILLANANSPEGAWRKMLKMLEGFA